MTPTIGYLAAGHEYQMSNWLGDVRWNRWNREEVYSQETPPNHWVFPQAGEVDGHTLSHTHTRQFPNLHFSRSHCWSLSLVFSPALRGYPVLRRSSLCLITVSGFPGMNAHVSEWGGGQAGSFFSSLDSEVISELTHFPRQDLCQNSLKKSDFK